MRFFWKPRTYTSADVCKPACELLRSDWLREVEAMPRTMTFRDLLHFEPAALADFYAKPVFSGLER
jgi:hypothetical protein